MCRKWLLRLIVLSVILGVAAFGGYKLFRRFFSTGGGNSHIVEWLTDPASHEVLNSEAFSRCPNPPLQQLKADNFGLFRVIVSEILVNDDLRKRYYEKILIPTLNLAEEQLRRLAATGLIADANIGLVVRSISGMLMGIIMENIMGDELIKEQWDELAEFLAALLLNGLEKR